jgi:hypothetical protein
MSFSSKAILERIPAALSAADLPFILGGMSLVYAKLGVHWEICRLVTQVGAQSTVGESL